MRNIAALALTFMASAHADDRQDQFMKRFVPQWQATCQTPGHSFRLAFRSLGGDPNADDMVASIQLADGPTTSLSLKPALFVAGRLVSNALSQCDSITAILMPTGNLLLFLRRDDRPSLDRLLMVLVDGKTGKTLDVVPDLGALDVVADLAADAHTITVLRDRFGVHVRLIRKWRQDSSQQEPTPISEWVTVHERAGKLSKQWRTSRP